MRSAVWWVFFQGRCSCAIAQYWLCTLLQKFAGIFSRVFSRIKHYLNLWWHWHVLFMDTGGKWETGGKKPEAYLFCCCSSSDVNKVPEYWQLNVRRSWWKVSFNFYVKLLNNGNTVTLIYNAYKKTEMFDPSFFCCFSLSCNRSLAL